MTDFILQAIRERKLGLALHYPLIHAAVIGLDAKRTFEFGAGGSTRVFVDALRELHRRDEKVPRQHGSVSTQSQDELRQRYSIDDDTPDLVYWFHATGLSQDVLNPSIYAVQSEVYDLVLHDGSHAADVVAADIAWVWPRIKRGGLLLVHDTQHSYCGEEVRRGILRALGLAEELHAVTLPYGFGLTIIRKESGEVAVEPAPAKIGGEHTTELVAF